MTRFQPAANLDALLEDASKAGRVEVAAEVVKVAKRSNNDDTGGYDKSLRVTVDDRGVVAETTDYAGHIIEWGKEGQAPQAPIRTGASESGRFDPA